MVNHEILGCALSLHQYAKMNRCRTEILPELETHGENQFSLRYGICANLELNCDLTRNELVDIFKTWEHYSGDEMYPISVNPLISNGIEYFTSYNKYDESEYGSKRMELLEHVVNELRKLCQN